MNGMSIHQAILKTHGSKFIDQLAEIAQGKGFEVKRESGQVKINAPLGQVTFQESEVQTFVRFNSSSPPERSLKNYMRRGLESLDFQAPWNG